MPHTQLHALILAAGQGTRMKSAKAKVLHPLLGRPLLSYSLDTASRLGAASTVVVVGHQADTVKAVFAGSPARFALQAEQRGTGHAVLCAREALGAEGTVLILTGDTPLLDAGELASFVAEHRSAKAAISVLAADYPDPTGYGRVIVDAASGMLDSIVEHRDANAQERSITLCNTGIYVCEIALLYDLLAEVKTDNSQSEYYLTDIVTVARKRALPVAAYRAEDYRNFLGINDRLQLSEAAAILQRRIVTKLQTAGVTINDPAGVYIEDSVQVEPDVGIEAGVHLAGRTRIASGTIVETGARIIDSTIAAGAHIKAYSVLEESEVGPGCVIGPMAHLRPATVLDADVHIGNYVETKKTRVGKGSKANHLTYLGDAEIGAGVNVGAGTITCNYDGVAKHKTTIDDGAFIGSDTQLVAPVRVGKGAVIGAGTTVTHDVPDDALAVSRAPQKDILDYRKRKAAKKTSS